ncbi:MAG: ISAs1 family transposase [Treponema sp.]|nr:ISAs1 family transposase [Treponema sp.]
MGKVRCRVIDKKTGFETEADRYFITSLTDLDEFADSVRKHWSVENQLHWRLDVIFREDASKAKKDNSPLNLNVLRKVSLSLLKQFIVKQGKKRMSMNKLMFMCALNSENLLSVLFPDLK